MHSVGFVVRQASIRRRLGERRSTLALSFSLSLCRSRPRSAAHVPALLRSPLAATRASRAKTVTVCAAQKQNMMAKAAAAGVPLTTFLAAHPAMALVDDRLATEGTGKIFGINDNAIFWNMLAIFSSVWAIFYLSQKDIDGDDNQDEDAGLSL